jgi:crotonobetainyl-CoA:carnitine CoA-transferase CaiB-like acyl-CoA transferase
MWNRSRRSVTVDLKRPDGLEAMLRLVDDADVVVETFRPGVTDRLGIGYEALHARNPRLVYCSCPGYPEGHRLASRPGYDALIQASSGQQWEQPGWRMGPIFLHMPMPSMGAMFLVPTGILAALVAREETGLGQHVKTSLFQGALLYTTQIWQHVEKAPAGFHDLMGKSYPPGIHQQMLFEVANGEWVHASVMSGLTPLASQDELLGLEDPPDPMTFLTMPPEEREKFTGKRQAAYKNHQRDDLVRSFQENNHAIEAVITMEEALGAGGTPHPQLEANGMIATVEDPELGTTTQIGVPINLHSTPGAIQGPQPLPGEHNIEIFGLLGFSDDEISAFSGERG